jgi:hypothetical protein
MLAHVEKADDHHTETLLMIDKPEFYQNNIREQKEQWYPLHIALAGKRASNFYPVVFTHNSDRLEIGIKGYTIYPDESTVILNPFAPDDLKTIQDGLRGSIKFRADFKTEILDTIRDTLPELYAGVSAALNNRKSLEPEEEAPEQEPDDIAISETGEANTGEEPADEPANESLKDLILAAAAGDRLPWRREIPGGAVEAPFNPVTGERFGSANLIAALLHKEMIQSADPRYLKAGDIDESGYTLKADARPLTLCYRTHNAEGNYEMKTELLYNADEVLNAPPYYPVRGITAGNYLSPESSTIAETQLIHDMAAYMAAVKNGMGYRPVPAPFENANYAFMQSMTEDELFSIIQKADEMSKGMLHEENSREIETGKQAVGMSY